MCAARLPSSQDPHLEWWPAPAALETPGAYNQVGVRRFGQQGGGAPAAVLVLSPGFTAGINDLDYLAAELTNAAGGRLQVWTTERRNHLLEDVRGAERAEAAGDPRVALGYYFEGDPPGFRPLLQAQAAFIRHWGLATALADLRVVVQRAREVVGSRGKLFLGGHSLGGMLAQCYAAWEFPEGPGHQQIDGVVLIDGAVGNPDWTGSTGLTQYEAGMAAIGEGNYYWDDPDRGAAPRLGILAQVAALAAALPAWRNEPSLVAPLAAEWLSLPPGVVVTNEAALGLVIDADTGPIASFQAHVGRLGGPDCGLGIGDCGLATRTGSPDEEGRSLPDNPQSAVRNPQSPGPVGWVGFREAGELTDLQRIAGALRQADGANGFEWYSSRLLNAEVDLSSNLDSRHPDTVDRAKRHGLRLWRHGEERIPVFGAVTGSREQKRDRYAWYAGTVATEDVTVLDLPEQEHMDPLFAENDGRNRLIPALADWLLARLTAL